MALLTIIIKHHLESMEVIKPLLDSINLQIGVDFNNIDIIISNNTDKWFNYNDIISPLTNIKNRIIYLKHPQYFNSIGMNVEMGIQHCKTPYYTICDCDDILSDNLSLNTMIQSIKEFPDYDILQFKSYVYHNPEYIEINDCSTHPFHGGGTWGVIVKKEFMVNNNIHYSPNVKCLEDIFVNKCIYTIPDRKIKYIDKFIYIWIQKTENTTISNTFNKSEEGYLKITQDNLVMTTELLEYVKNNPSSSINIYEFLGYELAYHYWRLNDLENALGSSQLNSEFITEANKLIVDTFLKIIPEDFFIVDKTYFENCINNSQIGNDETCVEWVERVFGINFNEIIKHNNSLS